MKLRAKLIGYFLGGPPRAKIQAPLWKVGAPNLGAPLKKYGGPLTIWGPRGPQNMDILKNWSTPVTGYKLLADSPQLLEVGWEKDLLHHLLPVFS